MNGLPTTSPEVIRTTGENLPQIPGGWSKKSFTVGQRQFTITLPALPDAFLDDPDVQAAHQRDEYMPYWPYLWPASLSMAGLVAQEDWTEGTATLEIGAGIGFVGLVALANGLRVTFSDYATDSVALALHNARQNGFDDARGLILDWRAPASDRYPVIFGCDVVYDLANHQPILNLLECMLAEGGQCWLGDAGRQNGGTFYARAREAGWKVELKDASGRIRQEPVVGEFQLMVLTR